MAEAVAGAGRASSRRALVWPLAAGIAGLASVVPFWTSLYLPYQDAPEHLAVVRILADYGAQPYGFSRWYAIDLHRLQYLGFYLPAAAISKWLGPDAACRLMLSIIALALVAAFCLLLDAFGRDLRLAVFAPMAVHTAPLYRGFFNFVESVPLAIVCVALTEKELRAPSTKRAVILAVSAALLLWLHPSALGFALCAAAVLAVTSNVPLRRKLRALAPQVPALALLCVWAVQAMLARDGEGATARAPPTWLPLRERVLDLLRFGNVLAGHADEAIFFGLLALFCVAAMIPQGDRRTSPQGDSLLGRGAPREERAWRLPLLALCTLVAYFAAPFDVGYIGYIGLRALPFLLLIALASPLLAKSRKVDALCAAAVALQIVYAGVLVRAERAFDREAQPAELREVLAAEKPGARLFGIIHQQTSHVVQFASYLHFASYAEVQRGGRSRYGFSETPWPPVRYRAGAEPMPLPRGWELQPESIDLDAVAPDTDYLLVRGPGPRPPPRYRLLSSAGRWSLYEARSALGR
jgi:hypothetical protein